MNAAQVRAYAMAKWPAAMNSPLAQAMGAASSLAQIGCVNTEDLQLRREAMEHAQACINACDGWTVETLGHNIESSFGMDLDSDECDAIAAEALGI